MRIGVDVGGTFTDVVLAGGPGGATRAVKVLTTPAAPATERLFSAENAGPMSVP